MGHIQQRSKDFPLRRNSKISINIRNEKATCWAWFDDILTNDHHLRKDGSEYESIECEPSTSEMAETRSLKASTRDEEEQISVEDPRTVTKKDY